MSTSPRWKNQLIAFLALTTVAGAGLAIHQHRQLAELERNGQLAVVNAPAATSAPQRAYLSRPAAPANNAAGDGVADDMLSAVLDADPAQPGPAANNNRRRDWAARMTELMRDPDFVEAWQIQQRARLDSRYAALFKQLNLPPAQLARLQDLIIERQNAWQDVMAGARASDLNPRENRDELREMSRALQAEIDAAIKTELGESTYAAYRQYDSTQSQRNVVNQLNQKLVYSGASLNPTQTEQLVSIIANNGGVLNEQTINLSRGLLTADQAAALQQLYAEQAAAAIVREKMRAGGGGGGGGRGR